MSKALEHARAMADIRLRGAQQRANNRLAQGDITARSIATLGEIAGGFPTKWIEARQADQQRQAQEQVSAVFKKHGPDLDGAIQELLTVNPELGLKFQEQKLKADTTAYEWKLKKWELQREEVNQLAGLLGSAKDQDGWTSALYTASQMGLDVSKLPAEYDPARVEQYNRMVLSAKDRLELDKPKAPIQLAQGNKLIDPETREVVAENPYTLTPDQEIDNKRADASEARMTAAQAETARHNRAMEANAARSGAGADAPGLDQTIDAIIANPAIYEGLTPTAKEKLIGPLAARGFKFPSGGAAPKAGGPNVGVIMDQIDQLSQKINTSGAGPMSNVTGLLRRGRAAANLDNDVAEYEALVKGMIPMVARAVGHVGVLTQQDVDSVRNLFPKVGDNEQLAKNKMARVRQLLAGTTAAAASDTPQAAPAAKPAGRVGPYTFTVE